MIVPAPALRLEDTVKAGEVRHRLALGIAWTDALTGANARGLVAAHLEAVGGVDLELAMDVHGSARHALRYTGRLRQRYAHALAMALDRRLRLRGYGARDAAKPYVPLADPRLHVPRRLLATLVEADGAPKATPENIRAPWLWPGAAYPVPADASAIRGRVLRGATVATGHGIRWARLLATLPQDETNLGAARIVGVAHGDERGEYLMVIDAGVQSEFGEAPKAADFKLRLWAFVPPADTAAAVGDPLSDLPLEAIGSAPDGEVLRGRAIPASHSQSTSRVLDLRLGEPVAGAPATFLFA